jgi:hypothetical protein
MKQILMTSILLVLFGSLSAQPQQDRMGRLKAAKIGFITTELALTEAEAQVFWPLYNKYESDKEASRKKMRALRLDMSDAEEFTEKEAEAFMVAYLAHRQEELDLEKAFYQSLREVLPGVKVAKLFRAERRFQREVLNSINGRSGPAPARDMRRR